MTRTIHASILTLALSWWLPVTSEAGQTCPTSSPNFDRVSTPGGREMVAEIRRRDIDADIAASGGVENALAVNASTLASVRTGLQEHEQALRSAGPLGPDAVQAARDQVALDRDTVLILEGMQELFACRAGQSSRSSGGGASNGDAIRNAIDRGMADGAASAEDRLTRERYQLANDARRSWSSPKEYDAAGGSKAAVKLNDPFGDDSLKIPCKRAIAYRDGELVRDWDAAMARARVSAETMQAIAAMKDDLLSESRWARSSGPVVALAIKQLTDTIEGVLTLASPRGSLLLLSRLSGEKVALRIRRLYTSVTEVIERGDQLRGIVKGELKELVRDFVLGEMGPVGLALDLVQATADNIRQADDYLTFQAVVREQVERLDREFQRALATVNQQMARLNAIETVKKAIDQACTVQAVAIPPRR